MASAKMELVISQLEEKMGMGFQRLNLCFRASAIQRNVEFITVGTYLGLSISSHMGQFHRLFHWNDRHQKWGGGSRWCFVSISPRSRDMHGAYFNSPH